MPQPNDANTIEHISTLSIDDASSTPTRLSRAAAELRVEQENEVGERRRVVLVPFDDPL